MLRAFTREFSPGDSHFLLDNGWEKEASNTIQLLTYGPWAQAVDMNRTHSLPISFNRFGQAKRSPSQGEAGRPPASLCIKLKSVMGGKDLSEEIFDFLLVRLKPVCAIL